jgi:hypothetical protein
MHFPALNETGRMYGPRLGVAEEHPKLTSAVLEQLTAVGYTTTSELDEITLLTSTQRADLFQTAGEQLSTTRHHGLKPRAPAMGWNPTHIRDTKRKARAYSTKESLAGPRTGPTPQAVTFIGTRGAAALSDGAN